jgi:hypothetical protein
VDLSRSSYVALAPFLRGFPQITTLGIRPCLVDYDLSERELLKRAQRILFPTPRFVQILDAAGKATFPSMASYAFRRSRTLQHHLLAYHEVPMPRARWYYGFRQKRRIIGDFKLPLMALGPSTIPGSKRLITTPSELWGWVDRFNPVLIQEYLPLTQRLRLICVNYRCVGVHQSRCDGNGHEPFLPADRHDPVVDQVIEFTLQLLRAHRLDDIALEWGYGRGQWWALGASRPPVMVDTLEGMINRHEVVGRVITEAMQH